MPAISIDHVSQKFGSFTAVDDVTISVDKGDIYALIGPNGAGKTTLVKMMVGVLNPHSGSISLNGFDINRKPLSAKSSFGYIPDEPTGYDYLSGYEYLTFTARLRGMKGKKLQDRIRHLIANFPLSDIIYRPMGDYSRGNKQKIAFLAALLTEPAVLIIDEPIVGLDPPSIRTFMKMLTSYAHEGHTVFFVTHILDFATEIANRAGVLKEGRLVKEVKITKDTNLSHLL